MTKDNFDLEGLLAGIDEPEWVPFPGIEGFEVLLQVPDAAGRLAVSSRVLRGRGPEQEGDREVFRQDIGDDQVGQLSYGQARLAVKDWRGLTVGGVQELLPKINLALKLEDGTPAPPETEVKFSPGLRDLLLRRSEVFLLLVLGHLRKREQELGGLEKNLSATPNTTPTATPGRAGGAGRKRKRSA